MKSITILGGLFLAALEVFANPLDVVGTPQEEIPAHEVEARADAPAWCCVAG